MLDSTSRRAMLRAGAALAGGCAASLDAVVGIRPGAPAGGPRRHVRREGVRRRRPALAERHGRLPGRHRCVHGRRRRDGAGAARRVQRRHDPAQGQRHAPRRSGRDALPEPGQPAVPARPARDGVRRERLEHRRHRPRHARRPGAVRVRRDARRRSRDRRGDRDRPRRRRGHAALLSRRRPGLHVHPEQLPQRPAARHLDRPLSAVERPPQRLRSRARARRLRSTRISRRA